MAEKIIGTLEKLDTRLDWLLKFSLSTENGNVWLGAKTKDHRALLDALLAQDNMAPEDRSLWEIEYREEDSRGKDGKAYKNRYVETAKQVSAPSPKPSGNGGGDRDAAISRAVAFKGVIDLLLSTKPKGDLKKLPPLVNQLTNEFESILDRSYSDDAAAGVEEVEESVDLVFEEEI